MRVAITGASGFVGQALTEALRERGDEPVAARRTDTNAALRWSTTDGFDPPGALSGYDAVVHLAGENIAGGRWSAARKARIRDSRVEGTRRVVQALRAAPSRPPVFVAMSAVGYYGARGSTEVDESAPLGTGFLAEVCEAWEREIVEAESLDGVRTVRLRLGTMLGEGGGALAKMLPAFKMGVGGKLGTGEQYMSWIHQADVVGVLLRALDDAAVQGVYNLTAPNPVTNARFTRALGKALHRPAVLPIPKLALRVLFGEMANHLLLTGVRAVPRRLEDLGYAFRFADIDLALTDLVGDSSASAL